MLIDCHNHTKFSCDAESLPEDMVSAAVKNGIKVFAITDHCDVDAYEKFDLAHTVPQSVEAAQKANETAPIKVLKGVELGQALRDLEHAELVLNSYDFDYVLGSVHLLNDGQDFYWKNYAAMTKDEIESLMERYYLEVVEYAKWNKFDSLAHISYPHRYIFATPETKSMNLNFEQFDDIVREAFKIIIQNGKAIENNSSSFTKSKEDYELNYKYMKMYKDLGGTLLTVGSDAHTPDKVGNGIKEGYEFLKEIGFEYVTYFENRKPVLVKI